MSTLSPQARANLSGTTTQTGMGHFPRPGGSTKTEVRGNGRGVGLQTSDIDGDGDADVLWDHLEELVWLENIDGRGTFGEPRTIIPQSRFLSSFDVADLDGDDDIDVVATFLHDDNVIWLENVDGFGTFERHLISAEIDHAQSVVPADLDGDGDSDIVVVSTEGNRVVWFESLGNGDFGSMANIVSNNVRRPSTLHVADIDGDGDIDVVASSVWRGADDHVVLPPWEVNWFENVSGNGDFGTPRTIVDRVRSVGAIFLRDLDADGDADAIIGTGERNESLSWYENDKW